MPVRRWLLLLLPLVARGANPAPEIKIDGRLDDPAWKGARVFELTQQAPRPGEPTPYKTTVRVLVTRGALLFGFDCTDPEPRRIAIHTMQRDGNMEGDDTLAVVLDTYGDRRTGYLFRINAAGARVDGLISGPEKAALDWDGIWEARTARRPGGWTAEMAIPARTLSFTKGLAAWGMNLERRVARDRTTLRWRSPTLDSFLYDFSRAGALEGTEGLEQGRGLDVSPYATGRTREFFGQPDGRSWRGQAGVDVTYRVTPQLAAVITGNTDFAETEVDSRQLNTTRFPLFFPERRAFFLEGSNQYDFGLGLGEQFIPFFSRRIGLFQGEQVPIEAGFKLNGRAGRWNIGLLDVQTRPARLRQGGAAVPDTNLFAGRFSYDVTEKLRLGTIVTNGNPDGIHSNTLAGFDGAWRTSRFMGDKNLLIGGWTAFTAGDIPEGNNTGWGFKIDYPNDLWDCFVSINQFGEALQPALGFLPRPGTRRYDGSCEYKPRPRKDGPFRWIRQQFMEHRFYRVVNYRGEVESQRFFWAPVNLELESGERVEFNWIPWHEYLPVPFTIAEGVTLPAGNYRFDRFRLEFETSRHRPWSAETINYFGTFYNGTLWQQTHDARYTSPRGRWQAGVEAEINAGSLRQGKFIQRLYQVNLAYAFSPDLVLTSFLQYDNESQNIGNNMRLRWTVKPGNDLFVVWNRGWKRLYLSPQDRPIIPETDVLAVKLRWTFRQ